MVPSRTSSSASSAARQVIHSICGCGAVLSQGSIGATWVGLCCHTCQWRAPLHQLTCKSNVLTTAATAWFLFCLPAGHQQSDCPKKAIDVYRLPDQLQSKVDEMYAKVRSRHSRAGGA